MQALPVVYENENNNSIIEQNVIEILKMPASTPIEVYVLNIYLLYHLCTCPKLSSRVDLFMYFYTL